MNYYQHHIGDFNNATRHLTVVERALYREAIELYYDTERPLPANNFDWLSRRLLASTEVEKEWLKSILEEFFDLDGDVYRHARCDREIAAYHSRLDGNSRAGKASAAARAKLAAAADEPALRIRIHPVQPPKNHEPVTKNQKKDSAATPLAPARAAAVRMGESGWEGIEPAKLLIWADAYPAVNVVPELTRAFAWALANPKNRKSNWERFLTSWLSKAQDKAPRQGAGYGNNGEQRAATIAGITGVGRRGERVINPASDRGNGSSFHHDAVDVRKEVR